MNLKHDLGVSATYPRRIARLFGYISAFAAGVFFIFFPPSTTTNFLNTSLPARMWGGFMLLGALVCIYAWFKKILVLDRIGLLLVMIGLGTLIVNQTVLMFDGPTLTRGGGTIILAMLFGFLYARTQDVKHDELLGKEVIDYEESR